MAVEIRCAQICALAQRRARFFPATDARGNPIPCAHVYRSDPNQGRSRTFVPRGE